MITALLAFIIPLWTDVPDRPAEAPAPTWTDLPKSMRPRPRNGWRGCR